MKKLLQVLMVLLLAVCVAACGSSDSTPADGEEGVVEITIGVSPDYPPYEDRNTDNELVGFDIDMVNLFPSYLNEDGVTYKFTWVTMDFDQIVTQIQGDQIDLGISGFTYDEERKVEWSNPYALSSEVAVVNPDSGINTLADLEGKVIAAQSGTTGEAAAKTIKGAKVVSVKDAQEIFTSLLSNQYYAVITDYSVAKGYVENQGLKMLDETLLDEKNYIIAKEGNTEKIELVNKALEKFMASDDYQKLCDKWGINPYSE